MSDTRRRRPSASNSTSHSREDTSKAIATSNEAGSSGSHASKPEDEEDDTPRRTTRGRNPLPPTKGPLFPPLPPKQPKQPKARSVSAQALTPTLPPPIPASSLTIDAEDDTASSERVDLPSTSNASLTPPPPGSEDAAADMDENGDAPDGADDWEAYQRHRRVRGFGDRPEIKLEEGEEEDVDATPIKRTASSQGLLASGGATPTGSVDDNREARADSASRSSRKRRGEEALLLDDHLLPEEMRRTGSITGKRSHKENGHVQEAKVEETVDEPEEPDDEVEDDVDDEDEVKDVTRCVCRQDDIDVMMIQCDQCNVWQHGPCMGVWEDEEAPDEYFCEECKPELHGPLKRWIRLCGRNPLHYVPPTPLDLKKFCNPHDKNPPSQSKRWPPPAKMEPPPKPPRSHHKKEVASPVEIADNKREGRNRTASTSSKPVSVGKESKQAKSTVPAPAPSKRKDSATGVQSLSPERSMSPSTSNHPVKKRSTMNSRDSAYEDAVKAALEASKLDMPEEAIVEEEDTEEKVLGEEEQEKEKIRKGKRKRDEEEEATVPPPGGKPKHPNQYTYRPKPVSASAPVAAPSPARRGAGTPVPTLPPPQHDHGTRRAGAIVNGAITNPALNAQSAAALNWYMPEHLSAFTDLLPASQPQALEVRSALTFPAISRHHFHNHRYGPFNETRDELGDLLLPDQAPYREPPAESSTHMEPPARIRFPAKRITVAEMRKRVRHMLDYVGKVKIEETKRAQRAQAIGLVVPPSNLEEGAKTAAEMMDELTRELLAFQETFSVNGFASPVPPPVSTFEIPHVPSQLSAVTVTTLDLDGLPSASTADSGPTPSKVVENGDNEDAIQDEPPAERDELLSGEVINMPEVVGPELSTQEAEFTEQVMASEEADPEPPEEITETTENAVDVYREGAVTKVVVQAEESEAAALIEKGKEETGLEPEVLAGLA